MGSTPKRGVSFINHNTPLPNKDEMLDSDYITLLEESFSLKHHRRRLRSREKNTQEKRESFFCNEKILVSDGNIAAMCFSSSRPGNGKTVTVRARPSASFTVYAEAPQAYEKHMRSCRKKPGF